MNTGPLRADRLAQGELEVMAMEVVRYNHILIYFGRSAYRIG